MSRQIIRLEKLSARSHAAVESPAVPLGYARTEAGIIPTDWKLWPVHRMGEVLTGKALAVNGPGKQRPYLRTRNVFDGRIDIEDVLTMPMTDDQFEHFKLQSGDVLLNEGQSLELVGRCAIYRDEYPEACAIQNQLLRFRARRGVCADFAAHLFRYCQKSGVFARVALQTTSIAHLGGSRFERLSLPWPETEDEQRAIAEALSEVDGSIASLEKLIGKKQAIKQAAMQQLLTGKTRLPGFRGKWEPKRLGDHLKFLKNGVNSRAELSDDGDIRYLHYGDIHSSRSLFLNPGKASIPYLSLAKSEHLDRLKDGDLIFIDASEDLDGVGKAIEIQNAEDIGLVSGLHTIAARFDKSVMADGFKAYLQLVPSFRAHLRQLAAGTKVYATNRAHISCAEVTLPGVEEQIAIAAVLSDMDAEIEALERRCDKAKQIAQGMVQQLLTGRIRLVESRVSAAQTDARSKEGKPHSWAYNEAIVISTLAKHFGKEAFPLGRKRYTKLSYLLHRHVERQAEGYLKKAAGPYNPKTKYGGPERIALESRYVREHTHGPYSGFVAADNIAQAEGYFEKWYGKNAIRWLEQFRFRKNDDLELLATVDMAVEELRTAGKNVDVPGVKAVMHSHPEWKAKLDREAFSDAHIHQAIHTVGELFAEQG